MTSKQESKIKMNESNQNFDKEIKLIEDDDIFEDEELNGIIVS